MKQILYIVLLFFSLNGFSQSIKTVVDSTQIKIGSQFHLILKANVSLKDFVVFPEQKFIGNLEVLESYPIDTIQDNEKFQLIKKYGLTQFDSGVYKIPPIAVKINNKDVLSDSASILVKNIKVDTIIQPMFDIKSIIVTKEPSGNWWKYLLFALFIVGTGFLAYYFIRKIQKNKPELTSKYSSPIQKANLGFDELEKQQLWQNGNVKSYYSELTNVSRIFIEETLSIPALESTSNELMVSLQDEIKNRNISIQKDLLNQFHEVLKNADLVKFAKLQPEKTTIEKDKNNIREFLQHLHKNIPESKEELQRQFLENVNRKNIQKERRKRTIISIGIAAFFLVASTILFALTIGYEYVKENYIGYTSKELLEKEWITSEYGNPAIKIETPVALTRNFDQKQQDNLPKEVKSTSQFSYGSILDNFSIILVTTTYKDSVSFDKDAIIQNDLGILESFGAKNVLIKAEEYKPSEELSGKKAFGTFTTKDSFSEKNIKMAFEIVVFTQANAVQEFILVYKDGDKHAAKMMERVRNSIELKKSNLKWKR